MIATVQTDFATFAGSEVSFGYLPPKMSLFIDFVIAFATADKGDSATWFAVDIPHAMVQRHIEATPLRFT